MIAGPSAGQVQRRLAPAGFATRRQRCSMHRPEVPFVCPHIDHPFVLLIK